jgi:hypothetical protein
MTLSSPSVGRGRKNARGEDVRLSVNSSELTKSNLDEAGTEHQSRTLMSTIVQVSGNGSEQPRTIDEEHWRARDSTSWSVPGGDFFNRAMLPNGFIIRIV